MAGLCLAVLLTRLPWLAAGYGTDPDSPRVIIAAQHIADTGEYRVSREPGYPLYEYVVAAVVAGGPWLTNGISAVSSVMAVLFFALILRHLRVRAYPIMALALMLVPVVFVNSTQTIDYIPALALILGSTYLVLLRRPIIAGALLGLAIGCRMTSGAMLVPLTFCLLSEVNSGRRIRVVLVYCATALTVGALLYIPPLLTFGPDIFTFYDYQQYPPIEKVLELGVLGVWGHSTMAVAVVLGGLLLLGMFNVRNVIGDARKRRAFLVSCAAVALYVIAFLRLPAESGYLIPLVPFVLLLIGLMIPARLVGGVATALVLAFLFSAGADGITWAGPIRLNHRVRVERMRNIERIVEISERLPANTVYIVAWELPHIRIYLRSLNRSDEHFVYFAKSDEQCSNWRNLGYEIVYLKGLDYHNVQAHNVDLNQHGARPLPASVP